MLSENRKQKRVLGRDCTSCGKRHFYDRHLCYGCYKVLNKKPNCICKNCNKEFYELPARIKEGRGQYCSRHCRDIGWSDKVIQKECLQCKKPFAYLRRIYSSTPKKFCSHKCSTDFNIGKAPNIGEEGKKKMLAALRARKGIPCPNQRGKRTWLTDETREKMRKHRLSQTFLKQGTDIEIMMKTAFDSIGLKYEHPYNLDGKFICDFGFPEAKIIVECDGSYWHSLPRNKHYDKLKESYCIKHNWLLLRFNDLQIKSNPTHLAKIIQNEVELQLMRMA